MAMEPAEKKLVHCLERGNSSVAGYNGGSVMQTGKMVMRG